MLSCYEKLHVVAWACQALHFPNVHAVAAATAEENPAQNVAAYEQQAKVCVQPAIDLLLRKFNVQLYNSVNVQGRKVYVSSQRPVAEANSAISWGLANLPFSRWWWNYQRPKSWTTCLRRSHWRCGYQHRRAKGKMVARPQGSAPSLGICSEESAAGAAILDCSRKNILYSQFLI